MNLESVEKILKYKFKNQLYLRVALTHRSYSNFLRKKKEKPYNNERVEFLGDAVIELLVSEFLYNQFPKYEEGTLTLLRSKMVRTETLANMLLELGLEKYIFMGKGEDLTDGRKKPYILANTYEAIVGAIFLDGGISSAKIFIKNTLLKKINDIVNDGTYKDPKTELQELIQELFKKTPKYEIINEVGPDHIKTYTATVSIKKTDKDELILGEGEGNSKQRAEENAAKNALFNLKKEKNVKN